jgi:hypothetical protein
MAVTAMHSQKRITKAMSSNLQNEKKKCIQDKRMLMGFTRKD